MDMDFGVLAGLIDARSADHYHRIPNIVLSRGKGMWLYDITGRPYLDMIAAYSAANIGHKHPRIVASLSDALDGGLATAPHAIRHEQEYMYYAELCRVSGMEEMVPMNTGAEGFETAVKLARKWGYTRKGIASGKAKIIVAKGNFHGRTLAALAASDNEEYRRHFGPFPPGFVQVPFGNADAIRKKITRDTAAVFLEPVQGEGGVNIPPRGYLSDVRTMCKEQNILFVLDEVQTGFGRTGSMFAFEHEGARPDILIVGKSLGGGVYPVSATLARGTVRGVFEPGDHGSTWGGNPYACVVGLESLRIIRDEGLVQNAAELGPYLVARLQIELARTPLSIREIRGRGLFVAIEFEKGSGKSSAALCEKLAHASGPCGLLAKEAGREDRIIRLSPPLCITKEDIDLAVDIIKRNLL